MLGLHNGLTLLPRPLNCRVASMCRGGRRSIPHHLPLYFQAGCPPCRGPVVPATAARSADDSLAVACRAALATCFLLRECKRRIARFILSSSWISSPISSSLSDPEEDPEEDPEDHDDIELPPVTLDRATADRVDASSRTTPAVVAAGPVSLGFAASEG